MRTPRCAKWRRRHWDDRVEDDGASTEERTTRSLAALNRSVGADRLHLLKDAGAEAGESEFQCVPELLFEPRERIRLRVGVPPPTRRSNSSSAGTARDNQHHRRARPAKARAVRPNGQPAARWQDSISMSMGAG